MAPMRLLRSHVSLVSSIDGLITGGANQWRVWTTIIAEDDGNLSLPLQSQSFSTSSSISGEWVTTLSLFLRSQSESQDQHCYLRVSQNPWFKPVFMSQSDSLIQAMSSRVNQSPPGKSLSASRWLDFSSKHHSSLVNLNPWFKNRFLRKQLTSWLNLRIAASRSESWFKNRFVSVWVTGSRIAFSGEFS